MRKKVLIGNWKMNNTLAETNNFILKIPEICSLAQKKDVLVGIAPSYLSLELLVNNKDTMKVYAQEVSKHNFGAFTGDISIPMIKDFKIDGSLVGHSERRAYHLENDKDCNIKIKELLKEGLTPIYCIGETLKEFKANKVNEVISKQLEEGLKDVSISDIDNVIIAYEPVWSIGTGENASCEIAEKVCSFIRSILEKLYSKEVAEKVYILYGGSVKPNNIHAYLLEKDVDGALVGGASLKADSFLALLENI